MKDSAYWIIIKQNTNIRRSSDTIIQLFYWIKVSLLRFRFVLHIYIYINMLLYIKIYMCIYIPLYIIFIYILDTEN